MNQDTNLIEGDVQKVGDIQIPERRVRDADEARAMLVQLEQDNNILDLNLARIRSQIDGNPPFRKDILKKKNQEDRTNVNFREMEGIISNWVTAYHDLLSATKVLTSIEIMVKDLDKTLRLEWQRVIAEEMTWALKEWKDFYVEMMLHQIEMTAMGMGPIHFDHPTSWFFMAPTRSAIMFEPGTKVTMSNADFFICRDTMSLTSLWDLIRNAEFTEVSESQGWNPEGIRKALIRAGKGRGMTDPAEAYAMGDWTALQEQIRNNDVGWALNKADVAIGHLYTREFSGKIRHSIFACSDSTNEWLYDKEDVYEDWEQCLHPFIFEVTSRQMKGQKGLGHKSYNHVESNNRLMCHLTDAAYQHATLIFHGSPDQDVSRRKIFQIGPRTIVPPGLKFDQSLMGTSMDGPLAVLNMIGQRLATNYRVDTVTREDLQGGNGNRSREQVVQNQRKAADVERSKITLYYIQGDGLMSEIFRRMTLKGRKPGDKSGELADAFIARCEARGIPREVLSPKVCNVKMARAIGFGSASERKNAYYELGNLKGEMDEVGRRNWNRGVSVDLVGLENADLFFPEIDRDRIPTTDHTLVALENIHLQEGNAVPVGVDQLHWIHAEGHAQGIIPVMQKHQQGTPGANVEALLAYCMAWLQHVPVHGQHLAGDPTRQAQVGEINAVIQDVVKWRGQLEQQVGLMRQRQQQEAEQQQARMEQNARNHVAEAQVKAQKDFDAKVIVGGARVAADERVAMMEVASKERVQDGSDDA